MKLSWYDAVVIGYFLSFSLAILTFITFTMAYLYGFRVTILINAFSEAHVEWFMVCIIMCISVIGLYGLKKVKSELKT